MSELSPAEANPDEPLQFDNAEFATIAPGRLTCTVCHREVEKTYYEINGTTVCDACRSLIEAHQAGGTGLLRIAKAILLGSLASLAGFAIYFGIMITTGMEIGLISILVGFMVGTAVRKGSGQRGGWVYQLLAVFLTYSAISASYLATGITEEVRAGREVANQGKPKDPPEIDNKEKLEPLDGEQPIAEERRPSLFQMIRANPVILVVLIPLSYTIPISEGLKSPIGLLIVGFALWEAWKLNRRVPLVFNGPFTFGGESAPPPTEVPSHA